MDNLNFALQAFFDAHESVTKLDIKEKTITFLKHDYKSVPINVPINIADFIRDYISLGEVHPDDIQKFDIFNDMNRLKKHFDENKSGVLFAFRRIVDGKIIWTRIIASVPRSFYNGDGCVLLYRRDLPEFEADMEEMRDVVEKKIHKVVKYNLTKSNAKIIKQRRSEEYIRREYAIRNRLSDTWLVEEGLIHPDDTASFKYFTDHANIIKYFNMGNNELSFYYRRKIGSMFKWVHLYIVPSKEYTPQNQVFLYIIEDIHHILTNLLESQGIATYARAIGATSNGVNVYYDNMLNVMSYFTQKYTDFYMIDIKNDLYVSYKIKPENVSGIFPYVGTYSTLSEQYIQNNIADEESRHALQKYTQPSNLRVLLANKASAEYTFIHSMGQKMKTIFTKIETEDDYPTKVICCTFPFMEEKRLKVKTFGNFEVFDEYGSLMKFTKKQSKQLLAYLIDKRGYPVSPKDVAVDVLEKSEDDLNAIKYVSTLARLLVKDLERAGYKDIVVKEWNSLRVREENIDCDYYHLADGDTSYWLMYNNEYMKEYSWAEETNAEILHYTSS